MSRTPPHMLCWKLTAAPPNYRYTVGTICRFIEGHPPADGTWMEVPDPRDPDQPPIGGFCDTCGHLAARHDQSGCTGVNSFCDCAVMTWLGVAWPRPWLSYADGGTRPATTPA